MSDDTFECLAKADPGNYGEDEVKSLDKDDCEKCKRAF